MVTFSTDCKTAPIGAVFYIISTYAPLKNKTFFIQSQSKLSISHAKNGGVSPPYIF